MSDLITFSLEVNNPPRDLASALRRCENIIATSSQINSCIGTWPRAIAEELFEYLEERQIRSKIQPSLTTIEWTRANLAFVDRCMNEPTNSVMDTPPSIAAHELVRGYVRLLREKEIESLELIEEWIEQILRKNEPYLWRVVIDGFLEHVFQISAAKKRFDHWRRDPYLLRAVSEAEHFQLPGLP